MNKITSLLNSNIMDKSKEDPQTLQAANSTLETFPSSRAGRTVSELLEEPWNFRQIIKQEQNLHLLSESLFNERQKLRRVLDWAHCFISRDSEVLHEFCRADSLILAGEELSETRRKSPTFEQSFTCQCRHPIPCSVSDNGVFGGGERSMPKDWHLETTKYHLLASERPFSDDPSIPSSVIPGKDEMPLPELRLRDTTENMKSVALQDATGKQTLSQDNTCTTSALPISSHRERTHSPEGNTNRTPPSEGSADSIKESYWSSSRQKKSTMFGPQGTLNLSYKTAGERAVSEHQMEINKVAEGNVASSAFMAYAKNNEGHSEAERVKEQREKPSNLSFSLHLKIPPTLTAFEQYQLCVDQLHHLRVGRQQSKAGCSIESPVEAPDLPIIPHFELNSATTNLEIKKYFSKRVACSEMTKEGRSGVLNNNQNRRARGKLCDNLTMEEAPAPIGAESIPACQRNPITRNTDLDLDGNKCRRIKGAVGGIMSNDMVINTPVEHLETAPDDNTPSLEGTAALTSKTGVFRKRIRCTPDAKGRQSQVKARKKIVGGRGASVRQPIYLSSLTCKEILQSPHPHEIRKHSKGHTPENKTKHTSDGKDRQKRWATSETHTPLHVDPRSTSLFPGACQCVQTGSKYSPPGVPACDCWLRLPDEVWLSILSLLPHSDLCRVMQVCSRLHTLATDHTLWKDVMIENSDLTERWLLSVSRRRPRSLCLHSCNGLSLTSHGLEMFFNQCRETLEELKVISCTSLGLHGDHILRLIGQLCDHVTSVDVSWSGATDRGVEALHDCCEGLQLKSAVLNGCHVTDDPLMKLVMRHKQSLCRLEVFGCQLLTPSSLQTVYKMCPGLEHLNIGQVPKVNAHSLTVMTSQLKCLISLNVTGLQAVTDATVDALLQNCVELRSLTLISCPRVTDLALLSISKYAPLISSLDVSGCKAITDAGVQCLALGCRRLQKVDLSSTGTGNRGVSLLANYCGEHLHTVKLSFCYITSENILKLCRRCKRLKVLHLYGCRHLPTEREIREVNTSVKVYPPS